MCSRIYLQLNYIITIFDMFKLRKETNYDLLHWSLFVACAFTLTFKIVELSVSKSMEIFATQPELAQYSVFIKIFG